MLFNRPFAVICGSAKFKKSDSSATVGKKNVLLDLAGGPFIAQGSHEWTTQFPSLDRENIGL